jgi:hypothetical protein
MPGWTISSMKPSIQAAWRGHAMLGDGVPDAYPRTLVLQESFSLVSVLEPYNEVIRVPDDDHVDLSELASPPFCP